MGFIDNLNTTLETRTTAEGRTEDDPSLLNIYLSCILQTNSDKTWKSISKKLVKILGQTGIVDALYV